MNTFYAPDRLVWRKWLRDNFQTQEEIWLVFPAKASGEAGVSYNDAVEEALCFGWIDGRAGTLDEMHHIRRFTPRRKNSPYSQPNIERLIWLNKNGMLHPKVRAEVQALIQTPFVFPKDILAAIKKDEAAWNNYCRFSEPYKRIRIAYIEAARKRPCEFSKRLENFISKTKQNKLIIGYGGIEKYYAVERKVIRYSESERKEHWLEQIKKSDWSASAFLHRLLRENTFFDVLGEGSEVLLLTEGDELISHCTFAQKDDIQPTDLTPWVGFVYTFPEHRGHRYAGKLFDEVERLSKAESIPAVFLSTNHTGLYEKYGFEYFATMNDIDGEPSKVYIKRIGDDIMITKRLILRRWEESDAADLYKHAKDPEVGPPAGWKSHESVDKSLEIIKNVFSGPEAYAVCLKEDGKPIGAIELMLGGSSVNEIKNADECELGYWLAKPFWGQGLIPEAARELLRRAFEDLKLSKVWCGYYDGNEKSKRVQEKLGLKYQLTREVFVPAFNETRTEHLSCITKEEWKNEL